MKQSEEIQALCRDLEESCSVMRDSLRSRKAASDGELAAYWPLGAENRQHPEGSVRAWIFCNANYTRFCDRLKASGGERARGAEADVLAALRDSPETITVSSGEVMSVHPKSFDALDFIAQRDRCIDWLLEQREKIATRSIALTPGLLDVIGNEISRQHGLIAWVATHAGAGLPFPDREPPMALPDAIEELGPNDYLILYQAFIKVNASRLYTLKLMLDARLSDSKTKAPSWLTFFAARADESHGNATAEMLMRDRSLGSQIATALLAAETRLPDKDAGKPS